MGQIIEGMFNNSSDISLTLVTVIMSSLDLFGLDLVIHRLHEIAGEVGFNDVLFSCRDDLT